MQIILGLYNETDLLRIKCFISRNQIHNKSERLTYKQLKNYQERVDISIHYRHLFQKKYLANWSFRPV